MNENNKIEKEIKIAFNFQNDFETDLLAEKLAKAIEIVLLAIVKRKIADL